jgi:hypothetical protein
MVQVLHSPEMFERHSLWKHWRYGIEKYGIYVTFNGITSLLNFMKIGLEVISGDRRTDRPDRQTDRMVISQASHLVYSF